MKNSLPLDQVVSKVAGLGVPGLMLVTAIGATGLTGAAAITAALAALGPGGMVGGIITLCTSGIIMTAVSEYGAEKILKGVIRQLYRRGETKESLKAKIRRYPVSRSLKLKLYASLDEVAA